MFYTMNVQEGGLLAENGKRDVDLKYYGIWI